MNKIKLFLENKGHRNPRACVHIHASAHACSSSACACLMHEYAYTGMRAYARVPKTRKERFFYIKTWFGTNLTLFGSCPKPIFFNYIKPKMVDFQRIVNQRGNFSQNTLKLIFF